MQVKLLNLTNPDLEAELCEDYRALYEGGKLFRKRAHRFLHRNPSEPADKWQARIRECVYRSYIGAVVDFFAAQLFSVPAIYKPVAGAAPEWFGDIEKDADGKGTDLLEFARCCVVDALVAKVATVALDFPLGYGQASSLYEADQLGGTDVRLRRVSRSTILDWQRDDRGNLLWWISKCCSRPRFDPGTARNFTRNEWVLADRSSKLTFQADVQDGKALDENSDLQPAVEVNHGLGRVPVVELVVDDGLWVANRLESAQLEHFRLGSGLSWSIKKTCYAMPVFSVSDPANFSPATSGAGYYYAIGREDKAEFLAPPVEHLALTAQEVKAQKDEIFRLVAQMALGVENNAAAVGRSGESKLADAEAIRVILRAYAALVRDFLQSVLNLLSQARGDKTEWTVEGLDKFETLDPQTLVELLTEAMALNIPSQTFQIESKYRAAIGVVPGLTEEQKVKIRDEIEKGVPEQESADKELREIARELRAGAPGGPEEGPGNRGAAAPAAPPQVEEGAGGERA